MSEKFKTKYHALAWAAEDENNVFVDGSGDYIKIREEVIYCSEKIFDGTGSWFGCKDYLIKDYLIKEPCHKLEPEKPSLQEQIDELKKQVEELNKPQLILPSVPGHRWIYDPSNPMKVTCVDAREK